MKEILLPTNINSKLNCGTFIHISFAPGDPVPSSQFPIPVMVKTKDNSYPEFEARILDMYRVPLNELANLECWQSHGLTASAFRKSILTNSTNNNPEMGVYFYEKTVVKASDNSVSDTPIINLQK